MAFVILPNVAAVARLWPMKPTPEHVVEPAGQPGRNELGRLNTSPRMSSLRCSRMANVRESAMSISVNPGEITLPGLMLPKVPVAGCAKAAGVRYCSPLPEGAYTLVAI